MDKIKQVVDKIVHPKDHSSTTDSTGDPTHTTGTHNTTGVHSTTGTHNTIGTHNTTGTHTGAHTGAHTGTTGVTGTSAGAGPHSSSLLNKADPTVDSDLDGSRNAGIAQHGPGGAHNHNQQHSSGLTGAPVASGTYGSATTGPHSSNLANKLDPRVNDTGSSLPGSHNQHTTGTSGLTGSHSQHTTGSSGLTGSHSQHTTGSSGLTGSHSQHTTGSSGLTGSHSQHTTGSSGLTGSHSQHTTGSSGLTGSHNQHTAGSGLPGSHNQHTAGSGLTGGYGTTSTNAGPHDSNVLNSIDPRVDSDRDGSRNLGAAQHGPGGLHNQQGSGLTGNNHGTTGAGLTGNNHGTGLTGTNHSSGLTGTHSGTHGLNDGPAPNTAGAHKSDLLNKLDPRIDSDRDGSKTVGKAPPPQY